MKPYTVQALRREYKRVVHQAVQAGRVPLSDRADFYTEIDQGVYDNDMAFFIGQLNIWYRDIDAVIALLEQIKAQAVTA
jgi:hypothetical protein